MMAPPEGIGTGFSALSDGIGMPLQPLAQPYVSSKIWFKGSVNPREGWPQSAVHCKQPDPDVSGARPKK